MPIFKGRVTGIPGAKGDANSLSIGTVNTTAAGTNATASITGTPPNQTLNLGIPRGNAGSNGANNALTIGTVSSLPAGSPATASITGNSPSQALNLGLPAGSNGSNGSANTLSIGTVSTLTPGSSATASITGASPSQSLNIGIPSGATGIGLSPGIPTAITVAFGTAYRPSDITKPYKVSVMIDATYTIAIAGTVADTCELWIGNAATVATTGGYKVESWRGSLTGILTLVGAGIGIRCPVSALVPAGWHFAVRRISGTTATIPEAYTTLLT